MKILLTTFSTFFLGLFLSLSLLADTQVEVPRGVCGQSEGVAKLEVPREYIECKEDADCGFTAEGCRSCFCPIAGNSNYIGAIEKLDGERRLSINDLRVCEACSLSRFMAKCESGLCATQLR